MFRQAATGLALAALVITAGCSAHTHVVGTGAQEWEAQSERQWYVAYGLAPLNDVDTGAMAAGLADYEIVTQQTFMDGVIGVLTFGIITARTVTVTK